MEYFPNVKFWDVKNTDEHLHGDFNMDGMFMCPNVKNWDVKNIEINIFIDI